jgi:hypothetical protein
MPDLKEVFEMTTKHMGEPDLDSWHEQEKRQRKATRNKKIGAIAVTAVLVVAGVVVGISTLRSGDVQPAGSGPKPPPVSTATTTFLPSSGSVEPGMYVVSAIDPAFDASYTIAVTVPDGYQAFDGWGIMKDEGREWMSASVVGRVYADPCHWRGTATDPPTGRNFHALVAALANQQGLHASTPIDVTLDGFAGKRMGRTVPASVSLADCDDGQLRFWLDTGGGERYTPFTGEHQELWVVDVDGVPLVIEAAWPLGASAQVQAELTQMVETINIEPQ